jgi:predicted RNA-binding protein with PUA-like domain
MKSEPDVFSYDDLVKKGSEHWDGVRNYTARNNLRAMKKGDKAFFYHSNIDKAVIGIVTIVKEAYQDPTTDDKNWVVVDLVPVQSLDKPVTLEQIKAEESLKDISLVRQGRLSVMPLKATEFDKILEMGS